MSEAQYRRAIQKEIKNMNHDIIVKDFYMRLSLYLIQNSKCQSDIPYELLTEDLRQKAERQYQRFKNEFKDYFTGKNESDIDRLCKIFTNYFWFITFPNLFGSFISSEQMRDGYEFIDSFITFSNTHQSNDLIIELISNAVISYIMSNSLFIKSFINHVFCIATNSSQDLKITSFINAFQNSLKYLNSYQIDLLKKFFNLQNSKCTHLKKFISLFFIPLYKQMQYSSLFCCTDILTKGQLDELQQIRDYILRDKLTTLKNFFEPLIDFLETFPISENEELISYSDNLQGTTYDCLLTNADIIILDSLFNNKIPETNDIFQYVIFDIEPENGKNEFVDCLQKIKFDTNPDVRQLAEYLQVQDDPEFDIDTKLHQLLNESLDQETDQFEVKSDKSKNIIEKPLNFDELLNQEIGKLPDECELKKDLIFFKKIKEIESEKIDAIKTKICDMTFGLQAYLVEKLKTLTELVIPAFSSVFAILPTWNDDELLKKFGEIQKYYFEFKMKLIDDIEQGKFERNTQNGQVRLKLINSPEDSFVSMDIQTMPDDLKYILIPEPNQINVKILPKKIPENLTYEQFYEFILNSSYDGKYDENPIIKDEFRNVNLKIKRALKNLYDMYKILKLSIKYSSNTIIKLQLEPIPGFEQNFPTIELNDFDPLICMLKLVLKKIFHEKLTTNVLPKTIQINLNAFECCAGEINKMLSTVLSMLNEMKTKESTSTIREYPRHFILNALKNTNFKPDLHITYLQLFMSVLNASQKEKGNYPNLKELNKFFS